MRPVRERPLSNAKPVPLSMMTDGMDGNLRPMRTSNSRETSSGGLEYQPPDFGADGHDFSGQTNEHSPTSSSSPRADVRKNNLSISLSYLYLSIYYLCISIYHVSILSPPIWPSLSLSPIYIYPSIQYIYRYSIHLFISTHLTISLSLSLSYIHIFIHLLYKSIYHPFDLSPCLCVYIYTHCPSSSLSFSPSKYIHLCTYQFI